MLTSPAENDEEVPRAQRPGIKHMQTPRASGGTDTVCIRLMMLSAYLVDLLDYLSLL